VPIVYTEARRLPKQRKENMETITASTSRLLEIISELDVDNYSSVDEIEGLIAQSYGEVFYTAIIEGIADGEDLHGSDIVRLIEDEGTARNLIGAFGDEIYDLFENVLRVA